MWHFLASVLDAILPRHNDVIVARTISEKEIAVLLSPRSASAPWIVALFPYRDPKIRAVVRALKYHGDTALFPHIGRFLGEYAVDVLSEKRTLAGWHDVLLVPMALSKARLRERGYSQAERIASSMLPYLDHEVSFAPHALSRDDRKSQVTVNRAERIRNVKGAFRADPLAVDGKYILLIDDVVETGATMEDARRALVAAGAKDVFGISVAH